LNVNQGFFLSRSSFTVFCASGVAQGGNGSIQISFLQREFVDQEVDTPKGVPQGSAFGPLLIAILALVSALVLVSSERNQTVPRSVKID
jgi:hypothetical protein